MNSKINNTKLRIAGTYSILFDGGNAAGCDSTAYLYLTINYSTNSSAADTACNSYIWNGVTYTSGGTYTHSDSSSGCTSMDTLHLVINYESTSSVTDTACSSFTWYGTTYTASGTYTHSYSNSSGCASTDTLHLVINSLTVTPANDTLKCSYDSLVITANGASTYLWSTGATTASIVVKLADTSIVRTHIYTVTGTDGSCSATDTAIVTWPSRLSMSGKRYNISCGTYCDTITLTGGNLPYSYITFDSVNYTYTGVNTFCGLWLSQSPSFIGIDANGCEVVSSDDVVVGGPTPPNPLSATCVAVLNASCSTCTNGIDSVIVSGGYPPYTYRWLPDSSTNAVDTGLAAGTYSVIVMDSTGCTAFCSDSIYNLASCSDSGYTAIADSDGYLPHGTYSGNLALNASLTIDTGVTVTFSGINLLINEEVSITVDSGATLIITCGPDSSYLHACNDMWQGIIVLPGGTVSTDCNTRVEDAEYGVEAKNHSNVSARQTTFNNDVIGIYVPPDSAGNTLNTEIISDCKFTCTPPLKPSYISQLPGMPIPPTYTFAGIYINDLAMLIVQSTDTFINLDNGIYALNSNVYASQGFYKRINYFADDSYIRTVAGSGIYAKGNGNILNYTGNGMGTGVTANFDSCAIGISTQSMNVNIHNAKITNLFYKGINITNGAGDSTNVSNNDISTGLSGVPATQYGITLVNNAGTIGTAVDSNLVTMQDSVETETAAITALDFPVGSYGSQSISDNVIYMDNSPEAFGIQLNSVEAYTVKSNNIYLSTASYQPVLFLFPTAQTSESYYGIFATGNTGDTITCNYITGQNSTNAANSGIYSIYSSLCTGYLYACDSVNYTYEGLHFEGLCTGTVQTNKFYQHYNGLHITSSSQIGEQYHEGNLWYGAYGNLGALLDNTTVVLRQPIIYYPATYHSITNNFPLGVWFQSDTTKTDQDCNTNNTCK